MNHDIEDELVQDLILINRRKDNIRETRAFAQASYDTYRKGRSRQRILTWSLSVTGAAAAILVLALTVLPSLVTLNGTGEFDRYYVKYHTETATRTTDRADPQTRLMTAYHEGNYPEALALSDSLLMTDPDVDNILFVNALLKLETGRPGEAAGQLNRLAVKGGSTEAYARWYLALIHIKSGDFNSCREQLSKLRKLDANPYTKEVNQLYRKLRFRNNR